MFHNQARTFIEKVIQTRKRLMRSGKSKISPAWATARIKTIERYLSYPGYSKDVDFAMFWKRNRSLVLELMTGGDSDSTNALRQEFQQIDMQHSIIIAESCR